MGSYSNNAAKIQLKITDTTVRLHDPLRNTVEELLPLSVLEAYLMKLFCVCCLVSEII